jgi:hypothetical protein
MDGQALTIEVGDLKRQGCVEPEAQAIDGGKVDLLVQGSGGRQEGREGLPMAREAMGRAETEATGAEAHRRGRQAIAVFAMQDVTLQLRFRDAIGSFVVALGQQADFSDRGCLSPFARATEGERRQQVLT